jgi:hypothetical protein
MDELIKSCRLLHHVIIGISAAIIAFAMTPDPGEAYKAALREIAVLKTLDEKAYAAYAKGRLTARREELASFKGTKLSSEGPDFVLNIYSVRPEVYLEWPLSTAPLHQIIQFYDGGSQAVEYGPGQENELQGAFQKALRDSSQIPIPKSATLNSAAFVLPSTIPRRKFGDESLLGRAPSADENSGQIALYYKSVTPEGSQEMSRYTSKLKSMEEYSVEDNLPLAWLKSQPNLLPEISMSTGGHEVFFPAIKASLNEIEGFSFIEGSKVLQDKLDSMKHEIKVLGLSVEERIAVWAAPAVLFCVVLYFYVHPSKRTRQPRSLTVVEFQQFGASCRAVSHHCSNFCLLWTPHIRSPGASMERCRLASLQAQGRARHRPSDRR